MSRERDEKLFLGAIDHAYLIINSGVVANIKMELDIMKFHNSSETTGFLLAATAIQHTRTKRPVATGNTSSFIRTPRIGFGAAGRGILRSGEWAWARDRLTADGEARGHASRPGAWAAPGQDIASGSIR